MVRWVTGCLLLVCVVLVAAPALAVGPPPIPIVCQDNPPDLCQCLCYNNYNAYWTYWEYGCYCGLPGWSVTCVECVWHYNCWNCEPPDESGYWTCETIDPPADGASACAWMAGECFYYSYCYHTGP